VDDRRFEHHVVVDRTRPLDFEVYAIEGIEGYSTGGDQPRRFAPFYRARDPGAIEHGPAYFQMRRAPRPQGASERTAASSATYAGSEVFVALVDPSEAPYSAHVRQLGIDVLCTNRHLPLSMPVGHGETDFTGGADLPAIDRIRCITGPSAPRPSRGAGRLVACARHVVGKPTAVDGAYRQRRRRSIDGQRCARAAAMVVDTVPGRR
jgi:type VI secretion system protein ImpG